VNHLTPILLLTLILSFAACSSKKGLQQQKSNQNLESSIKQFIHYHNSRDLNGLLNLYHQDYRSLSPVKQPENLQNFIQETLKNLEQNNFEVAVQLKEIEAGISQAFVSMNWQLKTKGTAKETDPFANVQRLDIWKLDSSDNWRIFRTIIYQEARW